MKIPIIIHTALIAFFINTNLYAQIGQLNATYNIINDTAITVTFNLNRTNTNSWNLGTSSFVINYNNTAMINPRIVSRGIWDQSNNINYSPIYFANYGSSAISIETQFNGQQGSGILVPMNPTPVGAIQFTITNPNALHNIVWNQIFSALFDDYSMEITSNVTFINPQNHLLDIKPSNNFIPLKFNLYQNYPNPFNPDTFIVFDIPKITYVNLTIYNIIGRIETVVVDRKLNAGKYKIKVHLYNLQSGVYFLFLNTPNFIKSIKIVKIN